MQDTNKTDALKRAARGQGRFWFRKGLAASAAVETALVSHPELAPLRADIASGWRAERHDAIADRTEAA